MAVFIQFQWIEYGVVDMTACANTCHITKCYQCKRTISSGRICLAVGNIKAPETFRLDGIKLFSGNKTQYDPLHCNNIQCLFKMQTNPFKTVNYSMTSSMKNKLLMIIVALKTIRPLMSKFLEHPVE